MHSIEQWTKATEIVADQCDIHGKAVVHTKVQKAQSPHILNVYVAPFKIKVTMPWSLEQEMSTIPPTESSLAGIHFLADEFASWCATDKTCSSPAPLDIYNQADQTRLHHGVQQTKLAPPQPPWIFKTRLIRCVGLPRTSLITLAAWYGSESTSAFAAATAWEFGHADTRYNHIRVENAFGRRLQSHRTLANMPEGSIISGVLDTELAFDGSGFGRLCNGLANCSAILQLPVDQDKWNANET
eukprot:scaffold43685_cov16-Tisochrysis_lutea.AAC.1